MSLATIGKLPDNGCMADVNGALFPGEKEELTRELEYFPEQSRSDSSAVAWIQLIAPIFVAIPVAILGYPKWALLGALLAIVIPWIRRKRRKISAHAILRIDETTLHITWSRTGEQFSVPLNDLLNVALDTKEIQRVQENAAGYPDLRFINSKVGPSLDVARIEFETRAGFKLLNDEFLSHLDNSEWFGKIRVFLRKKWLGAPGRT